MKNILCLLTCFGACSVMGAEISTFSAVGGGDNSIFVSIKKSGEKIGTISSLYELNDKTKREIKLPEELRTREIVGIFSSKKHLYIVSQMTTEQGDNPVVYENSNQKWNKVSELDCKNFTKLEVEKEVMNVFCEHEEKDQKSIVNKLVTIKGMNVEKKLILPQTEIKETKITAKLEGIPFEWEKITVKNKKTKVYSVSEF